MSGIKVRRGFRFPFAQIPEALLDDERVSDRGVRLWALIDRYSGTDEGAWPSRETLARRLAVSIDTLDRAVRDLEQTGWMHVERRKGVTSIYTLLNPFEEVDAGSRKSAAPPVPSGSRTVAEGGSRKSAAQNDSQGNERPPSPPAGVTVWAPARVEGRAVTQAERDLTDTVVAEFNRQAGTSYTGTAEHRRAIVCRIREYPAFDAAAHGRLIAAALADPWWRGAPGPQVVYGNAAVFEQSIERAKAVKAVRGLTDEEREAHRAAEAARAVVEQERDIERWWALEVEAGRATREHADRELAAWRAGRGVDAAA